MQNENFEEMGSNSTSDTACLVPEWFKTNFRAGTVIIIILGALSLITNSIVLWTLRRQSGPHIYFVRSLLTANMTVALAGMLYYSAHFRRLNDVSFCLYFVSGELFDFGKSGTLLYILVITFQHYMAICRHLLYGTLFTVARVWKLILILWVAACLFAVVNIPGKVHLHLYENSNNLSFCEGSVRNKRSWEYYLFTAETIFVIAAVTLLYVRVLCHTRHTHNNYQTIDFNRRYQHLTNIIKLMLITFVVCWFPICLMATVRQLMKKQASCSIMIYILVINLWFNCLPYVYSLLCPIIYGVGVKTPKH